MSRKHCVLIRALPCCVTGRVPAGTVHHLKSGPARLERGIGMKATDRWGVPMSFDAHILGVELVGSRKELEWFQERGILDPYGMAEALWAASPNFDAMEDIVLQHMVGVFESEPMTIPSRSPARGTE